MVSKAERAPCISRRLNALHAEIFVMNSGEFGIDDKDGRRVGVECKLFEPYGRLEGYSSETGSRSRIARTRHVRDTLIWCRRFIARVRTGSFSTRQTATSLRMSTSSARRTGPSSGSTPYGWLAAAGLVPRNSNGSSGS